MGLWDFVASSIARLEDHPARSSSTADYKKPRHSLNFLQNMDSIHEEISQGSTFRRLHEIIYGPILKVGRENAFSDCHSVIPRPGWPRLGHQGWVDRLVSRSLKQRDSYHWRLWWFSQFRFWFNLWRHDDVRVTKYSRRFSNSDSTFDASRFWKYEIDYKLWSLFQFDANLISW